MKFLDYAKWMLSGQAGAFLRLSRAMKGFYATSFLARAGKTGVLRALASGPLAESELMRATGTEPQDAPAFRAFLHLGVTLGEIALDSGRYRLKGALARALSRQDFDPFLALAEEVAGLHAAYIASALDKSVDPAGLAALTDRFSEIIARSSRVAEPVLKSVMESFIPRSGQCDLLEIGSGSGAYLLHALGLNAGLQATAVERVTPIAGELEKKVRAAGFASRARVVASDVRALDCPGRFDRITLLNNIYYFPESEHADLLARLYAWLKPGGKLAVATLCRDGGNPLDAAMHMWSAMTPGASVLVDSEAFQGVMGRAGFCVEAVTPSAVASAFKVFVGQKSVDA